MDPHSQKRLSILYNNDYTAVFKPLLAEVEANYEQLPAAILNEIRAFNDHISRCYMDSDNIEFISSNLDKAAGHMKRAIFDCCKYLNVFYHGQVRKFEKEFKRVDLTTVNDNCFYLEYKTLYDKARQAVREAKQIETLENERSFNLYQDALISYRTLDSLISNNRVNLIHAKKKFYFNRFGRVFASIVIFILGFCFEKILDLGYEKVLTVLKTTQK